jgi:pyrroline-5-carboxylate reductase
MKAHTIAFIGGGNMARSLIGGLIADGYPAERIWVTDLDGQRLAGLAADFQVRTSQDNVDVAGKADAVVLAVKPQAVKDVAAKIGSTVRQRGILVISIAAGVREPALTHWLGGEVPVVRTMPNTPALVKTGATALYANPQVSDPQKALAESLLRAVGITRWLEDESLMDAVTALSGSGPAYFFLLIEMLEQAGIKLGLSPDTARLLTLQTALGAAKMALESQEDVAILRQRVTSPGGTTEQAIRVLEQSGTRDVIDRAVKAAADRAAELGSALGEH